MQVTRNALTLEAGARNENIDGMLNNFSTGIKNESDQSVTTPSLSFRYQTEVGVSIFGGIHKGFSPAGPGATADAEKSINLELGLRGVSKDSRA